MLRLYSKSNKTVLESNDLILVDNIKYEALQTKYAREIFHGYGNIKINAETLEPEYVPNKIYISVNTDTNDFVLTESLTNTTETSIGVEINYEEYVIRDNERRLGKIVKYKDGSFYTFEPAYDKVYDPISNSLVFNLDKFKKHLINIIENSNEETRDHGYYLELFGEEWVQPFRESYTNDMNTLKYVRDDTPDDLRELKLFKEDPLTKKRISDPETTKWLKGAKECPKFFMEYMVLMTGAYHGYLPDARRLIILQIGQLSEEKRLRYIEKNYVEIMLRGLKDKIMQMQLAVESTTKLNQYFTAMKVRPLTNDERASLSESESE